MSGLRLYALAVVVVALGIWAAGRALDLAPPDRATIAAGAPGGGYHRIATRYAEILAEDGIALEILETAGSVENARLLAEGRADLAILQGGVPIPEGGPREAVAALFLEPILLFERADRPLDRFPPRWRGRRLAVGGPGSGTRFGYGRLARAMGLEPYTNTLLPLGGASAAEALLAGEVDLALFVAPVEAPYLRALFLSDEIRLVPLEGAAALARALPELVALDLPPGAIDYRRRVPPRALTLLATPARLMAGESPHPALVNRLVRAAERLHGRGDRLSGEGTFPSPRRVDAPLNAHARALLSSPPSLYEALLPYWVAAQINSFALLLVPVLFLLVPLLRALPGIYDWAVRRRIYRHYRTINRIDLAASDTTDRATLDALAAELDDAEAEIKSLAVPLPFRENAYLALSHLDLVRRRIRERLAER